MLPIPMYSSTVQTLHLGYVDGIWGPLNIPAFNFSVESPGNTWHKYLKQLPS